MIQNYTSIHVREMFGAELNSPVSKAKSIKAEKKPGNNTIFETDSNNCNSNCNSMSSNRYLASSHRIFPILADIEYPDG
jgi:hypothetical protein